MRRISLKATTFPHVTWKREKKPKTSKQVYSFVKLKAFWAAVSFPIPLYTWSTNASLVKSSEHMPLQEKNLGYLSV